MTSTALVKPWETGLPLPVIKMAKEKAVAAIAAWNSTVSGILAAAKAVHEVREAVGGKGSGSFSKWAVEELDKSQTTASCLADIGARHKEFITRVINLPPSWRTLAEIARIRDDDLFRRVLRRVKPDTERSEIELLVFDETVQPPRKEVAQRKNNDKQTTNSRALPAPSAPEPGDREQALTTIEAGSMWRVVQDVENRVNTALACGALSPEAKASMVNNHLRPSREHIEAMIAKLLEPTGGYPNG